MTSETTQTMNLNQFSDVLSRLGDMLAQSERTVELPLLMQEAVQESLLQRFEYALEIAWKSAKRYLAEQEGYSQEMGPKTVLRLCGELGLLDAETWLLYLQARQDIALDYGQGKARAVLALATDFYADARRLYAALNAKLPQTRVCAVTDHS
jgi:nucleotidyltransferase substrate binding protein (TIGR01987 family)